MPTSEPCLGFHHTFTTDGLKEHLRRPAAILLITGMSSMQACTLAEDDPSPTPDRDSADDNGGYELVIVDESVVPERLSIEVLGDNGQGEDAETPDTNLPGAVVFDREGDFTVQIGVYHSSKTAREQVLELSELGYPAYALGIRGESRVRVRIGYFAVREDAERFGEIFKEDTGSDYWIDRRVNEAP